MGISAQTLNRITDLQKQVHRLETENGALRSAMERLTAENHALTVAREIAIRVGVAPIWRRTP